MDLGNAGSHTIDTPPLTSDSAHVTKESLGRSTWLLLHTMAAQFPDQPDKSQQKDVKNLVSPSLVCFHYSTYSCILKFQ